MEVLRSARRLKLLKAHLLPGRSHNNGLFCCFTSQTGEHLSDFRSDTVTKPTKEMREAMMTCPVGDDVYGDDPTVNKLERLAADFLGKEASLFVPSGTMANLISVMAHCEARNSEMILGDMCHIHLYEAGGSARFGGIHSRVIKNNEDGTMDLDAIEEVINPNTPYGNPHFAATQLICIENTHNRAGGTAIPLEYMEDIRKIADKNNLKVHLDGARICNAATCLDVHPSRVARDADSVSMCFSKGLASPVGSVIAGTNEFIQKARLLRKCLGGGMRQAGVLAACAIISIEKMYPRLVQDHENALMLAKGLSEFPYLKVRPFDSNILFIDVNCDNLRTINDCGDLSARMKDFGILANNTTATTFRLVCHYQISTGDVQRVLEFFRRLD